MDSSMVRLDSSPFVIVFPILNQLA
jgi:hypothetical protein